MEIVERSESSLELLRLAAIDHLDLERTPRLRSSRKPSRKIDMRASIFRAPDPAGKWTDDPVLDGHVVGIDGRQSKRRQPMGDRGRDDAECLGSCAA